MPGTISRIPNKKLMGGKNVLFNSKEIMETAEDLKEGGCGCGCKGGKSYSKKVLFNRPKGPANGNKVKRNILQKI